MTGEGLRNVLTQLFGNTFLAMTGGAAIIFLFKREFVKFMEFVILAVLVATFIFTPEIWVGVARGLAKVIGSDGRV